jgi:hypothetical protein
MIRSVSRLGVACVVSLVAALASVATPQVAHADHGNWAYPTIIDAFESYTYSSSLAGVAWHLGQYSMRPCNYTITSKRADPHKVRVQFLERSTGSILYNVVLGPVAPGETVVKGVNLSAVVYSKELYMRYRWGDSTTWWEVDYFFNHPADTVTYAPFGALCP